MAQSRILLVQDSSFLLEMEKSFLKQTKATIFCASSTPEALVVARKVRPHLVYLDAGLAGAGGPACCRELKNDPRLGGVPVVMLVGSDRSEEALRCREAGCDGIIVKPLNRSQFLTTGRHFLAPIDRRELRVPCRATVRVTAAGWTAYGTIEDVSLHGMYIGYPRPVQEGEEVELSFLLPGIDLLMETRAKVAWVNSGGRRSKRTLPDGFGVEFVAMARELREEVANFLERSLLRHEMPELSVAEA